MKEVLRFIIILFLMVPTVAFGTNAVGYVPDDYTWTTQSDNSSGSMPCGGGSIGLNVWVENGDILFYAQRSGAFDANNTMLKAGRFRLRLFNGDMKAVGDTAHRITCGNDFRQTLSLWDGSVRINIGGVTVTTWVDVFHPVIHVELSSAERVSAVLSYESWRYKDRPIRKMEFQQCSYKFGKVKGLTTTADSIEPLPDAIWFYHVNADSTVFDATAWEQGLQDYRKQMYNPIGGLVSGGKMSCTDFSFAGTEDGVYASTDYRAWLFRTRKPLKRTEITIALGNTQNGVGTFKEDVESSLRLKNTRKATRSWWHAFWQRSHIKATGSAVAMARNYTLFRYMLGCNAYGQWPTKFNGGLFTFDPVYVNPQYPFTPDFRRWGGGTFTAQNQRLVYWGMLKSGDFDMLRPQLDFYARLLPTAMLRSRVYWNHGGANFNEQIENFGLPNIDEYGAKRPAGFDRGVEYNAWLEYTWDTALEFCQIALDANSRGGMKIDAYLPLIKQCLLFFDEHYQWQARRLGRKALDGDGRLVIYPGSACETFKMAYNPASTVAGLKSVAESLCGYLTRIGADSDSIAKYRAVAGRVPSVPTRVVDGHKVIAPAAVWARVNNRELPQLYPVFPWHVYGVGRDSLQLARDTWNYDPYVKQFKGVTSWEQANIFAADLGLTDEAMQLNIEKLKDGPYRFPAFWGPGHDWAPDHNWGGSGMIGLQEMLLQTDSAGNDIVMPAWPDGNDVDFKLRGTKGAVESGGR